MFYCPLHNWYSDEAPCPACHQTITTTVATSTEGTSTEPEVERPPLGIIPEWAWKEQRFKDVSDAIGRYEIENQKVPQEWISEYYVLRKWLQDRLAEQQSKQPLKPDTKEERIEVSNFMSDTHHRICIMDTSSPIPKEKYPSIKAAIESVLNNDEIKQVNFKDGYWVHPDMLSKMSEITGKIYTQKELDEAIQKAEKDAWNFAREKMIIDGKPTERQYRFLSFYDYKSYKPSSETLYQQSLQDNANSKTYNHVK